MALDMMKGWVEDLNVKNRALEEENKSLKLKVLELTQENEMLRSSNGHGVSVEGQVEEVNDTCPRQRKHRRLESVSDVNNRLQIPGAAISSVSELKNDPDPVDELAQHSTFPTQTEETPSREEDFDIDIKEEDVGYGLIQSKSNGNSNHDDDSDSTHDQDHHTVHPPQIVPSSVEQSSAVATAIKHEVDRSIQRMFCTEEQASNTEPVPGNIGPEVVTDLDLGQEEPSTALQAGKEFSPETERSLVVEEVVITGGPKTPLEIPPALLNIPDPPEIFPDKMNYLKAGLFSKHYKTPVEGGPVPGEKPLQKDRDGQLIIPGGILPKPAYCADYVTKPQLDFVLPYDVWCWGVLQARDEYEEWKEKQNADRKRACISVVTRAKTYSMPSVSWSFKQISSNIYVGFSKSPMETEIDRCDCADDGTMKCRGEDCVNRRLLTECTRSCGDNCSNRRIQNCDWAPELRRVLKENKEFGVLTRAPINKGDFIMEYFGEVMPAAVFKKRVKYNYANDTQQHHYCLKFDSGRVIDANQSGGEARFVNHSSHPNCDMQLWLVGGLSRMGLFALKDIPADEELTYGCNFSM